MGLLAGTVPFEEDHSHSKEQDSNQRDNGQVCPDERRCDWSAPEKEGRERVRHVLAGNELRNHLSRSAKRHECSEEHLRHDEDEADSRRA